MRGRTLGLLAAYPAIDPNVRGAALLDRSGHVLVATEEPMIGVDLTHQRHVQSALQGVAVISDIFMDVPQVGEVPTIAYLAPVFGSNRQVVCVAALWVRAAALWTAVKTSNALAGIPFR